MRNTSKLRHAKRKYVTNNIIDTFYICQVFSVVIKDPFSSFFFLFKVYADAKYRYLAFRVRFSSIKRNINQLYKIMIALIVTDKMRQKFDKSTFSLQNSWYYRSSCGIFIAFSPTEYIHLHFKIIKIGISFLYIFYRKHYNQYI